MQISRENIMFRRISLRTILSKREYLIQSISIEEREVPRFCRIRSYVYFCNISPLHDMAKSDDAFFDNYYTIIKQCLRVIGQWPYQSATSKLICFTTIFLSIETIIIPETRELLGTWPQVDDVLCCIAQLIIAAICTAKIVGTALNNGKMRVCFERIIEDWHTLRSKEHEQILKNYTEYGKRLATIYFVYTLGTTVAFLLQPLILLFLQDSSSNGTVYKLPFRLNYGNYIEKYYYLCFIHSYVSTLAHVAVWMAVDILLVILVQHACGLFSIVGHSLERVGRNVGVNYQLYLVKSKDNEYFEIFHSFRGHVRAIEFAQQIESFFSITFFFVGGLSMIAISATGMQVVINSNSIYDILRYAPLCSAQLFQLFYHCWQAQQLLDHSTGVYEKISSGSWYQTSARSRKLLCLMLTRRNRPCQLTAAKLYILSIETFCTIVRTSMSYFTLLRSAHTELAN